MTDSQGWIIIVQLAIIIGIIINILIEKNG